MRAFTIRKPRVRHATSPGSSAGHPDHGQPGTPRGMDLTLAEKIRVFHLCDKFGIRGARTHGVSRLFAWWFPRFDASRFEVRLVGIRPEDAASAHLKRQGRSEEHTSELQSQSNLVCRLLLEKKKQ